ncbi:MAG: methyltransferase domain-containing protein [Thermodesulfobacteriota bacterium]|nr:methyltransferase domain-containing protein [Thermodesulfobacteriota bacterium]
MKGILEFISAAHGRLVGRQRNAVLAAHISEMLPVECRSLLDVGCGDGMVTWLVGQRYENMKIEGVDLLIRPKTMIPVTPFNGEGLPHNDRSFDVVSFIDVLHHTKDPNVMLREGRRVARLGILIKDHVCLGRMSQFILTFMDWVGNRPHGVSLLYNYWSQGQWGSAWRRLGLEISEKKTALGLYPPWASPIFDRRFHFMAFLSSAQHENNSTEPFTCPQ